MDDSTFIFLSYGTLIGHIGSGMAAQQSFCKACQNCFRPSFTQRNLDASLLCCESSRKCHHAAQRTPTWTRTILTCFTKLIAEQPYMAKYE